ncbi:hypothetical protein V8J36_00290 [Frigidibacter sp. MR17.14]|uniref:hypothetical protein n=1 Tax=Frigidibacter sp. MR17.14 TaxID=3126509 RepID=UPI003012E175
MKPTARTFAKLGLLAALPLALAACEPNKTTITRTDRVVAAPVVTMGANGRTVTFGDGCVVTYSTAGVATTRTAACSPQQMTQAAAVVVAR